MEKNKIFVNGKIYTENPDMPWAQALVCSGKKLIYVGTDEGASCFEGEVTDLQGKLVIPGLIDGHTHPSTVSKTFWRVRGPIVEDRDELLEVIAEYAEKYPKEEVPYFFYECYLTETFGDEGPNRRDLDRIISDRPARIQDFGDHACWFNSVALEMLKDENGIPYAESAIGSPVFVKDKDGDYTGWCLEPGPDGEPGIYDAIGWRPPETADEEMTGPFLDYLKHYGVMCMMDGITESDGDMEFYYNYDRQGKLGMYYEATSILNDISEIDDAVAKVREWQEKYSSEHIHCNTVKYFIDGTNEMGDCLSTEPFHNDPEGKNCGRANCTAEEMVEVLVRLNEEKIDLHVHTICDGAFRIMCDAVEKAQEILSDSWCIRVTLAHCEIIHPDDIDRVHRLGIFIDWSAHWSGGYFGDEAKAYLGEERWNTMYDFTRIIDEGGHVGFSSDVFSYSEACRANPFFGMQTAATRIDPEYPLDPDEYPGSIRQPESAKLSVKQLVHGYTYTNALRMRLDHIMGSLEEGKLANFVVLEDNIFEMDLFRIKDTEVAFTCFEGECRNISTDLAEQMGFMK